jgi:hypothetical protein
MVVQKLVKKLIFNEIEKKLSEQGMRNDVMPGLVPLGDTGFWHSSLEPVSPLDCARYPDSPYCGGFPISFQPFGISPQIVRDSCNIGIRLNQTVGFIKFPPLVLVYRYPECRKLPPEPLPATDNYSLPVRIPPNNCLASNSPEAILLFRDSLEGYESVANYDGQGGFAEITSRETITVLRFDFPVTTTETKRIGTVYDAPVVGYVTLKRQGSSKANEGWRDLYWRGADLPVPLESETEAIETVKLTYSEDGDYLLFGTTIARVFVNNRQRATDFINRNGVNRKETEIFGYLSDIGENDGTVTRIRQQHYTVLIQCGQQSNSNRNNPPPPINKKPKEDMGCCPEHTALLNRLIKKVDKLSEIVGVDEYPASLPQSLISKDEGFLGNLIPNPNKEVANLTQFLAWYVERFDEIMGQWEIPIEIKDSDPNTPGDQPKGIKLLNMAEAIAEMFTLSYQAYLNSELMINLSTRNLIETGQDKRQNFITYKLLQSFTDYIGYKYKEVKADMPLMFTPEKVSFDELLKETKVKVAVPEFDEKLNFQVDLMRFRKAASILDSVFFKRVNPKGDIKGQLMKSLFDLLKSVNDFNEASDDNFDQFIDDAEVGFTNTPGITDNQNPYGRSYSQRPRIRDLSKPEDQQDGTP